MICEPISLFEEPDERKENPEDPENEATLVEVEPEQAEDRFFGRLKCAFQRGRCFPLCVSI